MGLVYLFNVQYSYDRFPLLTKDFSKRTLNGRYDIVLTNPTFSLMAMDKGGFQIIASQKKKLSGWENPAVLGHRYVVSCIRYRCC